MKNAKESVLAVYPNARVFEDIRDWGDAKLNARPFTIIDLKEEYLESKSIIEGKIKARGEALLMFGYALSAGWYEHIDDAWNSAWENISEAMLVKLSI